MPSREFRKGGPATAIMKFPKSHGLARNGQAKMHQFR